MNKKRSNVNRGDRLNAEFKKEIYEVITRRIKNPLITEMVSILRVDVTKDLAHAKVFVSVFSTDEVKKNTTFNAIVQDAKKIRHELAATMRVRTVPELHFTLDDSMEYSDKMNKIFLSINNQDK